MRFSIVCYLDDDSTSAVRTIQKALSDLTGAKASLNLWLPHVSIGDGIEMNESEVSTLQDELGKLASRMAPFEIELCGISKKDSRKGAIGDNSTPYGLYLDIQPNEKLFELVHTIETFTSHLKKWHVLPSPYRPHCTLAYRDLSKAGYEVGSKYLDKQNIHLQSKIASVSLVEILPDETREFAHFKFI